MALTLLHFGVLKFHLRLVASFFAACAFLALALHAYLVVTHLSVHAVTGHLAGSHDQELKRDWVSQDRAQEEDVLNVPSYVGGLVIHRLIPVETVAHAAADVPLDSLDVSSRLVLSRPPPARS